MASFNDVTAGSSADSSCVQQIIDALKGSAGKGVPISLTAVNDAANWALDVQNDEAVNSRALRVSRANGTVLLQADVNGVQVSATGGAPATVVTINDSQTLTNKTISGSTLSGVAVSTASPGVLPARLDSTTLTSSAASMTLSVTSSAYAHLEVFFSGKGEDSTQFVTLQMVFNNDTATNYQVELVTSSAAAVAALESTGAQAAALGLIPGSSAPANSNGSARVTITDYNSTRTKVALAQVGGAISPNVGGALVNRNTVVSWSSTTSITQIGLKAGVGFLSVGSRASLYGYP